jgi:hypothetical protein
LTRADSIGSARNLAGLNRLLNKTITDHGTHDALEVNLFWFNRISGVTS